MHACVCVHVCLKLSIRINWGSAQFGAGGAVFYSAKHHARLWHYINNSNTAII